MPKWNGLEVPLLPRGVYLNKIKGNSSIQLCANTEEFSTKLTNLVNIYNVREGEWEIMFWGKEGVRGWSLPVSVNNQQEALDYAVTMLWLGEVQYTLDEGRVDVRHED